MLQELLLFEILWGILNLYSERQKLNVLIKINKIKRLYCSKDKITLLSYVTFKYNNVNGLKYDNLISRSLRGILNK